MASPANPPSDYPSPLNSWNCDIVEVTEMEGDSIVRPMRESLRKRLTPPFDKPRQEPPKDQPPA
jgi:hypothetical protein